MKSKSQKVITPPGKVWLKLKFGEWLEVEHGPTVYRDNQADSLLRQGLSQDQIADLNGVLWRLVDEVTA